MKTPKRYNAAEAIVRNLPAPSGQADDYWEKNLELNEKNRIVASLRNVDTILTRDARWDGVLGFDQFANQVMKRKPPPYEGGEVGPWSDVDDIWTATWISHHYNFNPDKKLVMQAVIGVAHHHLFHPVREYLNALAWDRQKRLDTWLADFLGATEGPYERLAGAKFLIGAVARVMRPGCKMDNVLILEGQQGRWKSTALATLAGEWFSDTPFTIGDKDAFLAIRGNLIYELAELDGFSRSESSRAKAFFSSTHDTYVPKYVAWSVKVPRQCVFCGTVNHGAYLRDTTGNRRYWPVAVQRANIEKLAACRDQIWAEAVYRYNEGARWWVQDAERELFERQQELREVDDAFADLIRSWVLEKTSFTMAQLLEDCLHLDKSKWSAEQSRIGNLVHRLGWERKRYTTGSRRWYYVRCEREPGEEG